MILLQIRLENASLVNVPKISRSAGNTSTRAPDLTKLPDRKITWVAYLLFFMGGGGCLGFHRFYLGYKRSAQIQLALGVTVLFLPFFIGWNLVFECLYYVAIIWYFVGVFLIPKMVREANGALIPDNRRRQIRHTSSSQPTNLPGD